ncbi:MAG: hypothetical protein IPP73_12595 [Chitinophagaceae bacterium]|nr:hypothetical protein [Chitinophagaceae bacterium]
MALFDYHASGNEAHNHGYTDYNSTNNWIGFGNVGLAFLGTSSFDDHFWTIGADNTTNFTWIGGSPSGATDWDLPGNWEGGVPLSTSHVVIPSGRSYYPVVPAAALPDGSLSGGRIIGSIDIQSGATVNATTGTPTLNVTGGTGAWVNNGTFNAGSSTLVFSGAATTEGSTSFNNITVRNGASVTPQNGSTLQISGALTLNGSGVFDATAYPNIVDYNGSVQTVINPNGSTPGYYYLVLSNSGAKTMPATALSVLGDFEMTGTATAAAASAMTVSGGFTLGSEPFSRRVALRIV